MAHPDYAVDPTVRFWRKVDKSGPGGCWLWRGWVTSSGYGQFWVGRIPGTRRNISARAHRFAYESAVGPIPDDLQIDHLCRVRNCVNPAHLEVVTPRVNTMRGDTPAAANAAKTHCPKGHTFDEGNTYVYRGSRGCRECRSASRARHAARSREAQVA